MKGFPLMIATLAVPALLTIAGSQNRRSPNALTPVLGNYPNTTLPLSTDTTVSPDAPPTDTTSTNVSTSTDFKGTLGASPITGVVRVTDAHPAGTYTVTVRAFDTGGASATKTFTLTVTTPATCNPVIFRVPANVDTGNLAASVAVGDFNGDGKQDLAVANAGASEVSIFLGDGLGHFGAATSVGAGDGAWSVAVGDFNGDGKPDLAVADRASGKVSILLGHGDGTFGFAADYTIGTYPFSVVVGDFNGDGNQDLAVGDRGSNDVAILLGDGAGHFVVAGNVPADNPLAVALGDFNGDGNQDLAIASRNANSVSILLGDGAGNFSAATIFAAGDTPQAVAVGDFNNDGRQDLVVANRTGFVSILLGDGAGHFSSPMSFPVGSTPYSVAVADFDGNGNQDLVTANFNSDNVSILLGDGAGHFGAATNLLVGTNPGSVAVGDFNSDGKQDIAVANATSNNLSILLRDCTASWTEQAPYPIVVSGNAVASAGDNLYSFGGIANNVAIVNAYRYTPATNTWTPIASLPTPRGWFSAASDGTYIYLLGGVDQNFNTTATLWRYDPGTDTYNTSLPSYTIPTYFHATAYLNGKIYRIAGRGIGTDYHVEVYDIATNIWSMAANYPFANHSLMAVALGSYVYAGGGNASPNKTYRYDPTTDTWDDAAIADFPAGRSAAASGAYNGRWLLAGGDVNFAISSSAIAWDPATNTWNDLPNMVQARDYVAGATAGQSFYAVAGNSSPGTPTNDNQQYTETAPIAVGATSRMTHGVAGDFDVNLPLTGPAGIETRSKGGTNDYTMLVTFSGNVTVTGNPQAQVTMGTGCVGSGGACSGNVAVSGNIVTVPLTNIANAQRIQVRINGVNGGADAPATDFTIPMSILIGDTNANSTVNAADVAQTKARLGQTVDVTNFRSDVNANGSINAADTAIVKQNSGTSLPP